MSLVSFDALRASNETRDINVARWWYLPAEEDEIIVQGHTVCRWQSKVEIFETPDSSPLSTWK